MTKDMLFFKSRKKTEKSENLLDRSMRSKENTRGEDCLGVNVALQIFN